MMTEKEIAQSMTMFEKFLNSEAAKKILERHYVDYGEFRLEPKNQLITLVRVEMHPGASYWVNVTLITPKRILRDEQLKIAKDLKSYLGYFGFTKNVNVAIYNDTD